MTLTVIKNAFGEGRETDTEWKDSNARRDQIKLETFASNVDNFNGRRFNGRLPLARINPNTGVEEERFASRLAAARWIVENVLQWEGDTEEKAISITGNMHMCISNGWKSYGHLWRYLKPAEAKYVPPAGVAVTGEPVWVYGRFGASSFQEKVFPSIRAAARATGLDDRKVKRLMVDGGGEVDGFVFREYNAKPVTRNFASIAEFVWSFGLGGRGKLHCRRYLKAGSAINNTTIVINKPTFTKREVNVFVGHRMVKKCATLTDAAAFVGVEVKTLRRYANTNQKLKGLYRITLDELQVVKR